VDNSINSEVTEEGIQIDELTPSQQVTYELIGNTDESNVLKTEKFDFKKMSEKSKVSSVELEKNGLTVLELEDPIFDEVTL
jgi:inhibitor of KinA sporulation pathway (predicted exonuclease)